MGVITGHRHRSVTGGIGRIAYILALIGGILMLITGLLLLIGIAFLSFSLLAFGGYGPIVLIILGIIAIAGARRVVDVLWAVILIVVGFIAGGPAGILVLGGILGLVAWII